MAPDEVPTSITRRARNLRGVSQNAYAAVVADLLTDDVLEMLSDMVAEWVDKDGHGELVEDYNYEPRHITALYELRRFVSDLRR